MHQGKEGSEGKQLVSLLCPKIKIGIGEVREIRK